MGKGADSTTTSTSGDLPDYLKPYMTDFLKRAQATSKTPYQTYGNQRIADFSKDTNNAFDMIRDQADAGTAGLDAAAKAAGGIAGYNANPITADNTKAGMVTAGGTTAGTVGTKSFDFKGLPQADISAYMNPYINNVLDVQKDRLGQSFAEQQAGRDASAVAAGAFGGDRRFVTDSLAQRDNNQQLQSIEANGLSAAFDNATGLFNSDENRRLSAFETDAQRKLAADTGNVDRRFASDQFDVANKMAADTGNVDRRFTSDTNNANRGLQAATASEDARRLGKTLGLNAAIGSGGLYSQAQDQKLGLAQALSGVGSKIQSRNQAGLDMAYKDFQDQRDYPQKQLSYYASLLNGVPITPSSTSTSTGPTPDFFSQLIGAGTSAAGLWNLFGK